MPCDLISSVNSERGTPGHSQSTGDVGRGEINGVGHITIAIIAVGCVVESG